MMMMTKNYHFFVVTATCFIVKPRFRGSAESAQPWENDKSPPLQFHHHHHHHPSSPSPSILTILTICLIPHPPHHLCKESLSSESRLSPISSPWSWFPPSASTRHLSLLLLINLLLSVLVDGPQTSHIISSTLSTTTQKLLGDVI